MYTILVGRSREYPVPDGGSWTGWEQILTLVAERDEAGEAVFLREDGAAVCVAQKLPYSDSPVRICWK